MMKKKLLFTTTFCLVLSLNVNAQGWFGKLKDKVKEKVEQKVDNEVDKNIDKVLNGDNSEAEPEATPAEAAADNPTAATSSDFKRGSVIMFQDDVKSEQVGEFPSKWDLLGGKAEVKTLGGAKAIEVTEDGFITPLIKEPGAYLPEEFTIEFDFYYWKTKEDIGGNEIRLILAGEDSRSEIPIYNDCPFSQTIVVCDGPDEYYCYNNVQTGRFTHNFQQGWHHVALSFNKRALKVYFDGKRVVNLPRVNQPKWFCFNASSDYRNLYFIRNVVLAKGAVALYDRNAQSMTAVEKAIAETGKFVTNNILFETGKAVLKPESMAEIQKVADYMKKNASARFEVQGHTDNQGSDKINDPLSQQRAEAVVKALEGLGVDPFNLRAVGKGSHEPVADNKTEEGRAKNRRVEFIKK